MTKELYNLTVWYIKAYCYYKDVHDELFDEAAHIGGIEYDKEKVQSSNIYDNPKLIESSTIRLYKKCGKRTYRRGTISN